MSRDASQIGFSLVTGAPAALERAFLARVAAMRSVDPLAPVDVLVGGVLQRPYLQRLISETSPGLLNVRFHTLGEFGVRLGEATLAASGRRPLPAMAERALVAEVARGCGGYFAPVAATPGFADAARRLLRELRQEDVAPSDVAAHAAGSTESVAKADDLAGLYERYSAARVDTYDGIDALSVADPGRFDGATLLLVGVWRLSAAARRLLATIAQRAPVVVFLPTVAPDVDDAHRELREWLDATGAATETLSQREGASALAAVQARLFAPDGPIADDGTVMLVSAPDPPAEVREVARTCLAWAGQGIPFRQMVVAYRQAEVYRPIIEATFAEAGIPVYLDDGPSLAERPLGRRVLALLDLIESPLRRRDVIGFLSDGSMPSKTRERFDGAPVGRWDSLSRRAGVVAGAEQWRSRLTALREREQRAADDDPSKEWLQSRIEGCDSLIAFVQELADRFARRPERATWSQCLDYLRQILVDYVRDAADVVGYLDSLAQLDALLPPVEFSRFLVVVRAEVQALKAGDLDEGNQGAFGRRGVNVLDVNQLRNLRFQAVAVVGLTERKFPPPPRQDPLLLDDERARLNAAAGWSLPLRAWGPDPEPLQFALAVHAARERLLLSTSRAEEPGGRLQLPSSFFRAAVSAVVGERVTINDVEDAAGPVRRLRAGRVGAETLDAALTSVERDRSLLEIAPSLGRALLQRLEPRAARADALRRARWRDRTFTPFDGVFADPVALAHLEAALEQGGIVSPTRLQNYAECPLQYLLGDVLRLKPLEEPEDLLRISPLDKGTLVHAVLERFVGSLPGGGPSVATASDHHRDLMAIAHDELDRAEAQGLTGAPLLWNADRVEILEDLVRWLDRELADAGLYAEQAVEVSFGGRWAGSQAGSRLDTDAMLEIQAGSRTLRFRGRVDRLDFTPGQRFRVVDYKTGSGWGLPKKQGMLGGGTALQLPIYLRAGGMILEMDAAGGEAAYHLVSRAGQLRRIAFTGDDLMARADDLEAVLQRIGDGIASGDFHAEPDPQKACRYCAFDGLCDVGRGRQRNRKAADERAVSFDRMQDIA